jgi:hypothetical protein
MRAFMRWCQREAPAYLASFNRFKKMIYDYSPEDFWALVVAERAFLVADFLAAAFLAGAFFAVAFLPDVFLPPALDAFSTISAKAISAVIFSGSTSLGKVALIFSHFT